MIRKQNDTILAGDDGVSAPRGSASHRLHGLIAPRSVAIVGGSERNHYSVLAMRAIRGVGFDGRLHMINRRGADAFGLPGITSCAAIGEPVDAALLAVPVDGLLDAAEEAIAAGIRNLVIVTSGFAELGGEGTAREAALLDLCNRTGARVLGPNSLGFRNTIDRVALGSIPFMPQPLPGSIAIISASGSVTSAVNLYGIQQGVGFTHLIATGNEMNVTSADLIDYLVDVPEVRAIALFLESVRAAPAFARAAAKAHAARKPVVVLKVGAAEATAAVAAAHTGALVGDDHVFDAACDRLAIVRVSSIEDLVMTSATLAAAGPIDPPGVAFVSMSGGSCEIASDLAEAEGVRMPPFSEATRVAMAQVVSDLGTTHNPLDLTGAVLRDEPMWLKVSDLIGDDPAFGLMMVNWDVPNVAEPPLPGTLSTIGDMINTARVPALVVTNFARPINEYGRAWLDRHNIPFTLPGLGDGMKAVGRLSWWSERILRPMSVPQVEWPASTAARPSNERQSLAHLSASGVPVVPQFVATSAGEAARIARDFGAPVALKILSPDIAHKSELGGVILGAKGDEAVTDGYRAIINSATRHVPEAVIEGVLVAPMRQGGIELLVGIARDPVWGLVLAVGIGGIWVEVLKDSALCLLPTDRDEVKRAFRSLRAAKLLDGYRGAPAVDLDRLADVVISISEAALALGPDLAALEVNPLFARGDHVEALDALAVWNR